MKKLYLFQPQKSWEFNNKKSYWLPYSVGCLWSYARQNPRIAENYQVGDFFFARTRIDKVLEQIQDPDLAVFSCYIWNWEYNKILAARVKQKWPNCRIIFGGPQVTNKPYENSFFKEHPYVDNIINGEGEIAFENLLIDLLDGNKINKVIPFTRLTDLSYPSPYLSGVFDDIMKRNPDSGWQMVLETNRGCPYACTFCDWGSLTYSKVSKFPEERVIAEFDWASRNKIEYLYFADANFGILYERDKKFATHLNHLQETTGYPAVAVATWAKNARDKIIDIAKIFFKNNHNRGFTLSMQSMDETVLDAIKRKNMDINNLADMVKLCEREGIAAYTDMILGLPYETRDSWIENFDKLLNAGQHSHVDVWWSQILENSELNTVGQRSEHKLEIVKIKSIANLAASASGDEDDEIQEIERVVKSTATMSYEDIVDSYMFSHVVCSYHHTGWTQIVSRFLHKYTGMSYKEFYTRFHDYVKNSNGLLAEIYNEILAVVENTLSGQELRPVKGKNVLFHGALYLGVPELAYNKSQVHEEIFRFVTPEFSKLDPGLYDTMKQLQIHSMYDRTKTYPYVQEFDYNILDYILESELKTLSGACKVEFTYPYSFQSEDEFRSKLSIRRLQTSRSRYKVIEQ